MQELVCKQFPPQKLEEIREPSLMGGKDPICHRLARNRNSRTLELLLLPVQRQSQNVFAVQDMGQQAR